eukprot:731651-Hanusia_phi.AAC.1
MEQGPGSSPDSDRYSMHGLLTSRRSRAGQEGREGEEKLRWSNEKSEMLQELESLPGLPDPSVEISPMG